MALKLRDTLVSDLPDVLAIEAEPDVARWVSGWPADRHRRAISDPDEAHMVFCRRGAVVGYLLLAGLSSAAQSLELRRIALRTRDEGLGADALELALGYGFDVLGADRVWLDVLEDNARARRLYDRAGFTDDGLAGGPHLLPDGTAVPLRLMSIRQERWRELPARSITPQPEP